MIWKLSVAEAISNTSPLLYLHRVHAFDWLPRLFTALLVPGAVVRELEEGARRGCDVPDLNRLAWLQRVDPRSIPSEWLALDLGAGELAVLALGLEQTDRIILLDDGLARRIARAASLTVWGTLKVLLEAKSCGFVEKIAPLLIQLKDAGMWISDDIARRILVLAGETAEGSTPSR